MAPMWGSRGRRDWTAETVCRNIEKPGRGPKAGMGVTIMEYGYYEQSGSPFRGAALEELKAFLARMGLTYDGGIEYTTLVRDGADKIIAAASLQGSVIKCVAVDPSAQGEGLTATLITALRREALTRGQRHLFLYTKPQNRAQFTALGFYEIARTGTVLLMEDKRTGFMNWAEGVRRPDAAGVIGAVVMNCNPMTLGHRYLVEQAAARCDFLYLFVVSEDRSAVPAADRRAIVEAAVGDMPHGAVAGTDRYLISSATFPDYFLKDKTQAGAVWTDLDIAVFCRLAKKLGITRRFVGSEPFCPVTAAYNRAMAAALPEQGIELVELTRLEREGAAISATAVRELIRTGQWQAIRPLVPETVYAYFAKGENRARVLERMGQ